MILVTRLNKQLFYLNCDLIELIEETPDTLITMTTGKRFLVEESAQVVLEKIINYRNLCFRDVTLRIKKESTEFKESKESKEYKEYKSLDEPEKIVDIIEEVKG